MPTGCPSNGFLDENGQDLHDYRMLPLYGYQKRLTASRGLIARHTKFMYSYLDF